MFFIVSLLSLVAISTLYLVTENTLEKKSIPVNQENKKSDLNKLHKKYKKLDVNADDLDLEESIKKIQEDRKHYPLDDKLKTIEMELEHKRANQAYKDVGD